MTTGELGGKISERVAARSDRLVLEEATEIIRELRDRFIPFRRISLQRLRENRIEVPSQHATQTIGSCRARGGPRRGFIEIGSSRDG